MNILADENVDASIVLFLRQQSHDVLWMAQEAPGTPDAEILLCASRENRIILTFDRDFGELVFHYGRPAKGIILLRLQSDAPSTILSQFQSLWPRLIAAAPNNFVVATFNKIRIRPLPLTE